MVEQVKGVWLRNFLKSRIWFLGMIIITLTACGGGGGGEAATPAPSGVCDAACVAKAAADKAAADAAAATAAAAAKAAADAAAAAAATAAAAKFTIGLGIPKEMDIVRVKEDI
jgi:hypothetical protein